MKEVCGNCKYNKRTFDGHCNAEFCCGNENSDYYAVPTAYDDTCEDWEEKAMSRYIDTEKLGIGTARPEAFYRPEYAAGWNSAIEIIKNAPTADVEEVVRCKDCIFSRELDEYEKKIFLENCVGCAKHSKSYSSIVMQNDDFCSYGEKK